MKFGSRIMLVGPHDERLDPETVERILDELYDMPGVEDVDAVGSLASKTIDLEFVVEALDIDSATAHVSSAIRFALQKVGGEIASDDFRKTDIQTHELADA